MGKTMQLKFFIYRILKKITSKFEILIGDRNLQESYIKNSNYNHSMVDLNEKYYLNQYLFHCKKHLDNLPNNFRCLDLGSGDGRFVMYILKNYKDALIEACDIDKKSLKLIYKKINSKLKTRVVLENTSITEKLKAVTGYYDLILFTEVAIYLPNWEESFSKAVSLLNKNGIIIFSTRSQYYQALSVIKNKNFKNLNLVMNRREGEIFDRQKTVFTWNTSKEIKDIFFKNKLEILNTTGIGCLSGIENDIISYNEPKNLNEKQQKTLLESEAIIGDLLPDAGRYILTIGKKTL